MVGAGWVRYRRGGARSAAMTLVMLLFGAVATHGAPQIAPVSPTRFVPPEESARREEPARLTQARAFKEMGDNYVAEDRLDAAADSYLQALALGRDAFTADERVDMAVYISWEDKLDEASEELKSVLAEHPDHIGARSHLARVYSWSGRLSDSIVEADKVLEASPGNQDALLVKADALEWGGHFRQAIPVYREILQSGGSFEAGIGLSYALLSGGNRSAARESALALSPVGSRQIAQLEELTDTIRGFSRPRIDLRHNYYQDSDDNQHHRYSALYGFGLGNTDFQLQLTRVDSRNNTETRRSRAAGFDFTSVLTEGLSIGAGVGVSQPGTATRPNLMTGNVGITSSLSNGTISANVSSSVLVDTAELIENRIRAVNYGATIAKPVTRRLSVSTAYQYKDFSDGNHAHDIQLAPEFLVAFNPRVSFGYLFRYQDYGSQTGSGYFDPTDYVSNRAFGSIYYENSRFYAYANVFAGRQRYTRNAFFTDDAVLGGNFSIGFTPVSAISIEVNAEGGNFAAGSVSGFTYYDLGSRATVRF